MLNLVTSMHIYDNAGTLYVAQINFLEVSHSKELFFSFLLQQLVCWPFCTLREHTHTTQSYGCIVKLFRWAEHNFENLPSKTSVDSCWRLR